ALLEKAALGFMLAFAAASPLDIELFHSLHRLSIPAVSPDQGKALYTTSYYEPSSNKEFSYLSLLDINTGTSTQLTPALEGDRISNPLWLGSDKAGYLVKGILYQHSLEPNTNGTLFYNASTGIANAVYRAATDTLFFTADVYPDGELGAVGKHTAEEKARADSAQIFDNLWARHWNKWMTHRKANVFAASVVVNGTMRKVSKERNLMGSLASFKDPLLRWEADSLVVSEDGGYVAFVARNPGLDMAWSTDVDIYLVPADGSSTPKLITGSSKGIASSPVFSKDSKYLAWLQMETPGYESDINRIYIYNISSGMVTSVARDWELSPQSIIWSPDSQKIYALTPDKGDRKVISVDVSSGARMEITGHGYVSGLSWVGSDKLLGLYSNTTECQNIYTLDANKRSTLPDRRITDVNKEKLKDVVLSPAEDFWFKGALGDPVHGWLLKPYGFDSTKQYPLALLIHGGPQQANMHLFSYSQWNPNMYAGAGFVTVQINFHGSLSYGQNFTDSIQQQWGGHPYEDLMKGLDYVVQKHSFVDPARVVALGASYGGYMVNWMNANTDRFSALVSHDGQFNLISGYYATDELWFPEHDLNGVPFTSAGRQSYERWNPERFASSFKTPTLFIHGERDYRLTTEEEEEEFIVDSIQIA
ncbi:dipeptidylpeptidase, partial [Dipsacomyces acuminosporus]